MILRYIRIKCNKIFILVKYIPNKISNCYEFIPISTDTTNSIYYILQLSIEEKFLLKTARMCYHE